MNSNTNKLILPFLISLFMMSCSSENIEQPKEVKENAVPVSVKNISYQPFNISLQTIGRVNSMQLVPLYFSVPGKVDSIFKEAGEKVQNGDALASIESDQYEAQYILARSAWEKAQNDLKSAKELFESNIVSKDQFDIANVGYNNAQANYITAKKAFENTVLKAPFDGSVISRNLEVGALASPGGGIEPPFIIGDMENLKVMVSVPESDIGKIKEGQKVLLTFKSFPGKKYTGSVKRISLATKTMSNTFDVEIEVKNTSGDLRLGLIADVEIITQELKNAIVLPVDQIHESNDITFVYAEKDKRAIKVPVEILYISGSKVVLKGLANDTRLIVKGHNDIMEGSLLELAD